MSFSLHITIPRPLGVFGLRVLGSIIAVVATSSCAVLDEDVELFADAASCSKELQTRFPLHHLHGPQLSREEFLETELGQHFEEFFMRGPGHGEHWAFEDSTGFSVVSDALVLGYEGSEVEYDFIVKNGAVDGWGGCSPALSQAGSFGYAWQLVEKVDRDTTALVLRIVGRDWCAPGRNLRIDGVNVREFDDRISIAVWAELEGPGAAICTSSALPFPERELTIELDEPVGSRKLVDVGAHPPQRVRRTPTER